MRDSRPPQGHPEAQRSRPRKNNTIHATRPSLHGESTEPSLVVSSEGERAALKATLTRLVRLRFRDVPSDVTTRTEAATTPDLERWIERILTVEQVEALFE